VKRMSIFDIRGRGGFYFHPESRFKELWSIVIIIFLLYVAFLMPYSLAFNEDKYDSFDATDQPTSAQDENGQLLYYVDMMADFIFLMDVFVTCFSAYYDEQAGLLVTSNKVIFMVYFKRWFFIDLLASLPISLIEDGIQSSKNINAKGKTAYIKLLRLLRLPRLHRLLEVSKLGKFFRTITKDSFLLKF
jgi:Ion transport protein